MVRRASGTSWFARTLTIVAAGVVLAAAAACGEKQPKLPAVGSADADKFLYDRGMASLEKKKWVESREYFKKLIETYPQSQYRADAKLGVGDSYLGERHAESYVLGVNEFKEFLQYFPLNPRADYAQYKICEAGSKQMLSPERDQTATRDALRECDAFLQNFPTSSFRPQVETVRREARDRLSESEFQVGLTYFHLKWWAGAISRLTQLVKDDPGYSKMDAVYFYLGESYYRALSEAQAVPNYNKVIEDYPKSEYVARAKARLATIKIKH
ncbi:MAG TPA: outer membrane protein assembly factor BamD [Vicinamibacterales bacterium]|nr:outer membrane protein assembly factor BamD [Vicinamibacterales bacterium]